MGKGGGGARKDAPGFSKLGGLRGPRPAPPTWAKEATGLSSSTLAWGRPHVPPRRALSLSFELGMNGTMAEHGGQAGRQATACTASDMERCSL
jgi:hypothetical protein